MTLHVTRIVLMQDLARHPNWHAVNLYGTSYSDRVQALCAVAKRLGIEVALHGEWACAPQAAHLTPVATSFDARPARPGDLWVGSTGEANLSLGDTELFLLRRLVEKLEAEAAVGAQWSRGRQVLYREYLGYEAASGVDRDVAEALNGPDIDDRFQGTLLLELRYVEPTPPPQIDLPPFPPAPPSAKRNG